MTSNNERLKDVVTKICLVAIGALGVWVMDTSKRVTVIEANRFTHQDAISLERRLKESLPPKWLRDDITEIKLSIKDIETRMRKVEAKIK